MSIDVLKSIFKIPFTIEANYLNFQAGNKSIEDNQSQTKDVFSEKWDADNKADNIDEVFKFQKAWFLSLYGFSSEDDLKSFLSDKSLILDAGCGLGYKAAWFADLAPHAIVLGIDISDSLHLAAKRFSSMSNLFFYQGNIADTMINGNTIDFTVCDQVIMHTEDPIRTFAHLSDITSLEGEFACYVYAKKALPREFLDDYFRKETHNISKEKMWEMSTQLTQLGKSLSELNVNFECPDIPLLGIKGGTYDIQRFIYWNFLKCFWKEDWGFDLSTSTNFDWYAPSNAMRFSESEFKALIFKNNLEIVTFHEEQACYAGRFKK